MASVSSVNSSNTAASSLMSSSSTAASDANAAQDRFLKLLVAQLNNQDPMNPMDNAQMTSQMAQINTVTGITKLNETMSNMVSQLLSTQILQGASLVGHQTLVSGNTMEVKQGVAAGAVELDGTADKVSIEIRTPGGQLIDSFDMGAQTAGRHEFTWDASGYNGTAVNMVVNATNAGKTVAAKPLAMQTIQSISNEAGVLKLNLASGNSVRYDEVSAMY